MGWLIYLKEWIQYYPCPWVNQSKQLLLNGMLISSYNKSNAYSHFKRWNIWLQSHTSYCSLFTTEIPTNRT
uniref:Uncharacterized protein n=1 Tax=Arundo donax TaxID=35708 RepID=A0A0A8ZU86_ARUDO